MIVAQKIVNKQLDSSDFVYFITYFAQVSRITLEFGQSKQSLTIRVALWPSQYAWGNVPSHDPDACGRRKASRAPQ